MTTDPLEARYVAEMLAHATTPVVIEVTLSNLGEIVAGIQLALRHPRFPLTVRAGLESFLVQTIAAVGTKYPAVAEGWRRGNDPGFDVPRERRGRR
jgi:hypothetical protein